MAEHPDAGVCHAGPHTQQPTPPAGVVSAFTHSRLSSEGRLLHELGKAAAIEEEDG